MTFTDGVKFFLSGFSLIQTKGLKRFVLVPLIVNFILFSFAIGYLLSELGLHIDEMISYLPNWLSWLGTLIYPVALFILLFLFSFFFTTAANWLAAPFNGVLAERVEQHLSGQKPDSDNFVAIVKAIPHTLSREWQKLIYFIPRFIGYFLVGLILPGIGQIIWFLFIAWVLAIQYCDYAFDNNKYSFEYMRHVLRQNKAACFGFGSMISLFTMVPILNLLVMPVAICGATAMWVEHLKQQVEQKNG
ncbi:sulfate transporter CysZ [Psychrosphaera saromensis]|uniref:Sulfate transporter CysZ n=1 Tax=Psychrosphaera saromensis TaxID=716813 RepID=A0A2S7UXZ6_9GAMM|nr:sulfate transporter CysZ [Psychrosphaera saromensis]PQJ54864.1 sulfate transporter CysZ [Psychrosphaera saromensis]GHB56534.1 sulfate transporter CysZ [Psychrosphaera saromensis]GLQ13893.1 sulfate transporter CysZ [Psychrosphaera saromensis]